MATLSVTNPTLADWSKVIDPNGSIAQVIGLLSQMNEITDDMVWNEGNLPTGDDLASELERFLREQ